MSDQAAAKIYPVTIKGTERHVRGNLEGCVTPFGVRHVSHEAAREWYRAVRANEAAGKLKTVKETVAIVDTATGEIIELLNAIATANGETIAAQIATADVIVVGWRNMGADFWTGDEWSGDVAKAAVYDTYDAVKVVVAMRADGQDVDAVQRWGEPDERTLEVTP